jgi:hypothetical protein
MRADDRAIDDKIRMPFRLWFLKDQWSVLSPLSGSDGLSSHALNRKVVESYEKGGHCLSPNPRASIFLCVSLHAFLSGKHWLALRQKYRRRESRVSQFVVNA